MTDFADLNEAFGKALVQQFFEPVLVGRGPNGEPFYSPSGVALLAQNLYREHAAKIMEDVWGRIDMDELATKIATQVVDELTKVRGVYERKNVKQEELADRVMAIAAGQLGQRVVETMDIKIETKETDD